LREGEKSNFADAMIDIVEESQLLIVRDGWRRVQLAGFGRRIRISAFFFSLPSPRFRRYDLIALRVTRKADALNRRSSAVNGDNNSERDSFRGGLPYPYRGRSLIRR